MASRRKEKPLDRTDVLAQADRARARGRRRKAIALYQTILAVSPHDATVHVRVAPLLAAEGRRGEAMASFRIAAAEQESAGFTDRSIAILRQAADHFPEDEPLWSELAELQLKRGRRADAMAVLVAGGERLMRTRFRPMGAKLLRRALELEPWNPRATLLLARTLGRERRRPEAVVLLEALAIRVGGAPRRTARGLAFRLSPSPGRLWRWLAAALSR